MRMATLLHVFAVALLFAACVASVIALLFGLPVTFAIVGVALMYAWATGFQTVRWSTIGWIGGLALAGEVFEFLAAGMGAAGARPSRRALIAAVVGSFAGAVLGAPFFFGIGALLGALAGAFAGAAFAVAAQGGTMRRAFSTGLGALRGRLLGFVLKAAIAAAMSVVLLAAVLA